MMKKKVSLQKQTIQKIQKMLNKKYIEKVLISLLVAAFAAAPLFAEKIVFSANRMTGQAGNSNTTTSLSGNAYIKTESMEIQADEVELSGDNYRYIKATGNITGKNTKSNMDFTCDELEYDRTTKIAILKGNVNLDDKDNDVKAESQIIEYNQKSILMHHRSLEANDMCMSVKEILELIPGTK